VEVTIQSLLATVDKGTPVKFLPCDVSEEMQYLKLGKVCGLDGIPNECLRHLPIRPLVDLTHLFNRCFRLIHFPTPWKEEKFTTLPKPGKDPKFSRNLRPIRLLSNAGKLFEKLILRTIREHTEERNLINICQFIF
jgi:hypothetical protein